MIKIKIRWNQILNKIRITQSALRWTIPLVLSLIKDDLGHLSVSLEMLLHAIEIILLNLQNNPESGGPLQECSGQGVSCLGVSKLYMDQIPLCMDPDELCMDGIAGIGWDGYGKPSEWECRRMYAPSFHEYF